MKLKKKKLQCLHREKNELMRKENEPHFNNMQISQQNK